MPAALEAVAMGKHRINGATDSVWIETDLVENYLAFGRETECAHVHT